MTNQTMGHKGNASRKMQVYDPVRQKYVALTPEEQVRQFVIRFLHKECGVPLGHISAERPMRLYEKTFRTDLQVKDRQGKAVMVIECKRPGIPLDEKVLEQAMRYNMGEKEKFVVVTNGREFKCYAARTQDGKRIWTERDRFPDWAELAENVK